MPADRADVVSALVSRQKFRFEAEGGPRHDVFELKLGGRQFGWTMVSRGSGYRELDDRVLAKIARQLHLPLADFKDYLRCRLNWPDYARHLRERFPEQANLIPDD